MKTLATIFLTLTICSTMSLPTQAQEAYPSKAIKILVGFTPGGVPDITARFLSTKLNEAWKQPVVVENRVGAGSNIAAQALATSASDGYTLLSVSSAHAVAPAIYAKLPFDAQKDFSGITLTATGPALVIVAPNLGVKTMAEFIALAKAKPGQLNFASAGKGSGSHFAVELLKNQAGIDIVHVPYKGIPEALTETIAGRVQVFIAPYASAINLVKEGKAIAIAVTSTKRLPEMPDLPTVAEANLPGFAPLGISPVTSSPEDFDKLITSEITAFTRLAKAANIKPE
jgi:tripartite-type tricarboxylate transporter receptor subunit TctC